MSAVPPRSCSLVCVPAHIPCLSPDAQVSVYLASMAREASASARTARDAGTSIRSKWDRKFPRRKTCIQEMECVPPKSEAHTQQDNTTRRTQHPKDPHRMRPQKFSHAPKTRGLLTFLASIRGCIVCLLLCCAPALCVVAATVVSSVRSFDRHNHLSSSAAAARTNTFRCSFLS